MSKMNPNEKKENASKNENVNNEEATLPALTMCRARWKPCKRNITN